MKKFSTLLFVMLTSIIGFTQAITIDASDVPLPPAAILLDDIFATNPANPITGLDQTWNYSSYFGDSLIALTYPTETDPFFTSAGVDFHALAFKGLTATLGYFLNSEIDFNSNGVFESGLSIDAAKFSLLAFTGSTLDSMIIPAQKQIFLSDKTIMKFPYTIGSGWHSMSRRFADFNLTVSAFGLNHTQGQHVYTTMRSDTIIGWGKMRVYTSGGPSIDYDVLMDKVHEYNVDSFYLGGAPASPFLLSAFGVSQGQHTNESYFYRFNRKGAGSYPFIAQFSYGNNATYTTLNDARINLDNLTTGINDLHGVDYSTLVFPNPTNSNEVNIKILGHDPAPTEYAVFDLLGMNVQQGKIDNASNDMITLSLNDNIGNGTYVIRLMNKEGKEVIVEKVNLQR
ncbi:MAG: T9SS type A sorting domain-containing protein [Saprospiraceae bacterium]